MTTMTASVCVPDLSTSCACLLFLVPVSAGFPAPGDDDVETKLDLHQHRIKHEAATFFVRVRGDSMLEAGIHSGDLLIGERALEPTDTRVVIAIVKRELTVKRLCKMAGQRVLMPSNGQYAPLHMTDGTDFDVWGVVTHVMHAMKPQ